LYGYCTANFSQNLLRRKYLVSKKGLEPQSFGNALTFKQIATSAEYNRLIDFCNTINYFNRVIQANEIFRLGDIMLGWITPGD